MKPSTFKRGIEKEFDYICKQPIRDEQKDYRKYLRRLSKKETTFSMFDEHFINQFSTTDHKPSDYHTFSINQLPIHIENDLLANALKQLSSKKREILLLYYFLELDTQQIADILKLHRSTVYRNRKDALKSIKQFMEENANENLP
ncbi:RNA polymerase sigma factor [Marinilactibacillus sp. Marseille-P9653]|uniref:RNA polymerase sigma factor n=1 Tax=Marinilactibacillus sp. Marseille-P9653 TaxID=2866583 RepID=UPI001CE41835|nr:sigma-70 family RNA polymerase sigma factor [Marinilactibacillus sp. Marseille-P9653]